MNTDLILHSSQLPDLSDVDFFHSPVMFHILERTPGMWPCMVVVRDDEGRVLAWLLAQLRRRGAWLPPYLFTQGRVYGEGVYAPGTDRQRLFGLMVGRLTAYLHSRLCFYVEFSDFSQKMFGYKALRRQGYFPVSWMRIHNSLHSLSPALRLSDKTLQRIRHAQEAGLEVRPAADEAEVRLFYRMLRNYYRLRVQRYVPPERFFLEMWESRRAEVFVTVWQGRIIGGAGMVTSGGEAFLWYVAAKEKRYHRLRPTLLTVWAVIDHAYKEHMRHIHFMHVGLPFRRNRYRDFILQFGGKPVSGYRWFRFTLGWLNSLLSWFYRE